MKAHRKVAEDAKGRWILLSVDWLEGEADMKGRKIRSNALRKIKRSDHSGYQKITLRVLRVSAVNYYGSTIRFYSENP